MKNIIKGQIVALVSLLAALTITLAACGGGGSSSAGGGNVRAAVVSGTVSGGSTAGMHIDISGTASMIAAVSDLFVRTAHAAGVGDVRVVLDCGNGAVYEGDTDAAGKFKILVPNVGTGTCTTTFNGISGPPVNVAEGMETEVEVSYDGAVVSNAKVEQHPDSSTQVEIEVENDQNSSEDDLASNDDQNSSEDDLTSNDDQNSSEDDLTSNDDQNSSEDDLTSSDDQNSNDDNNSGDGGTG